MWICKIMVGQQRYVQYVFKYLFFFRDRGSRWEQMHITYRVQFPLKTIDWFEDFAWLGAITRQHCPSNCKVGQILAAIHPLPWTRYRCSKWFSFTAIIYFYIVHHPLEHSRWTGTSIGGLSSPKLPKAEQDLQKSSSPLDQISRYGWINRLVSNLHTCPWTPHCRLRILDNLVHE